MREPILLGLLLSACLHLAIVTLIQPSPGSSMVRTVVINARLEPIEPRHAEVAPAPTQASESAIASPQPESRSVMMASEAPSSISIPVPTPPLAAPKAEATPPAPQAASAASKAPATGPTSTAVGPADASALPSLPLGIDTTWYQARNVDVHPKAIRRVEPDYPPEARRRNLDGTLKLMLKIDDLGRVQSAEVVEANPPGVFEEAALEAFRKARFHPAMKDGRPVRYEAYIRVDFRLED